MGLFSKPKPKTVQQNILFSHLQISYEVLKGVKIQSHSVKYSEMTFFNRITFVKSALTRDWEIYVHRVL